MNVSEIKISRDLQPLKIAEPEVPHAVIETNYTCNRRCRFCYNRFRDVVKPLEQIESEIDQAIEKRRLETISILGGEPTLQEGLAGFFEHKCRKIQTAQTVPCFEYVITNQRLGNTQFHFYLTDRDEALVRLKRGNLGVLIEESNGRLTYHFDPLNPEAQLTYLKLTGILPGSGTRIESGEAVVEPLTVRGTRYIDFLIPGC